MARIPGSIVRFGPYEVSWKARELRKYGLKVKLQQKPLQILMLLLERAGEVVTREELREQLWGDEVFIDCECSLSAAINKLREALNDSPTKPRFVETLPRQGYRFIGTPVEVKTTSPPEGRPMLAVLPFENLSGDPSEDFFSDGLTEEMILQLGRLHPERLGVIARTSIMQYKGTNKNLEEIGRELGVGYVLEGSVRRAGGRVRITAQLVQVNDQTSLWAESYDRDLSDILALQSEVAQAVAREIKIKLTPQEQARLSAPITVTPAAYEAYLKGRYFGNKVTEDGYKKSLEYFKQAVHQDPYLALAHAGVADTYIFSADTGVDALPPQEAMPKAKAAATKALEIDPTLAAPHASLAMVAWRYHWDWKEAEREFRSAIQLNPNYPTAHLMYCWYLAAAGRLEEATAEIEWARGLDPLSLIISANVGWTLIIARRYERAIQQLRRGIELDPNFALAHHLLGRAYAQQAQFQEATAELQKAIDLSGGSPFMTAVLGNALALAGKRKEALNVLKKLQELSKQRFVSSFDRATVYVGLGQKDQVFFWLERAYEERTSYFAYLKVDPMLDSLHGDPRFADLIRRIGFPP